MNSTATKPTIRANDPAQLRALQQGHNYRVTRTATGWTVRNIPAAKDYHVTVAGECDCPHFRERLASSGGTCKHFAMADLAERLGRVEVPAPAAPEPRGGKRWSEMSREERIFSMCGPDL